MGKILLGLLVGAVIELYAVILVAGWIGFWSMLGLLVLLSLIGMSVIRMAGMRTMRRYAEASATGGAPGKQIADGAVMLTAGVLLLIPGFVSGVLGLLLLLPPVRALVRGRLSRRTAATAQRFGGRFGVRGTTVIATYEHDDIQDTTATDVRGELPPRDRRPRDGRRNNPDR
jgi:UPF0716 protein FxsA